MIDKATLDRQLEYTAWATRRLLDAVLSIPPEHLTHDFKTADRTIVNTLAHVFAADRVWLDRVNGRARAAFVEDRDRDVNVLREEWPALLTQWRRWINALDETLVGEPIGYKDFAGNPHKTPPWEIILHVVNHGTHHRGQVAGFLRTLGHVPPPLDMIRFYRNLD
jgi:uncharacterized damage-inducible protein DinB